MNKLFQNALDDLNKFKRKAHIIYVCLSFTRALCIAALITPIWAIVDPNNPGMAIILGLLSLLILVSFISVHRSYKIHPTHFLFHLDILNPTSANSPFYVSAIKETGTVDEEWSSRLNREIKRIRALETRRLTAIAGSMVVPFLATILLWPKAYDAFRGIFDDARGISSLFSPVESLFVITGSKDPQSDGKAFDLNGSKQLLELLPQNMLKYSLHSTDLISGQGSPSIEIIPTEKNANTLNSTIQLSPQFNPEGKPIGWSVEFSISESSEIFARGDVDKKIVKIKIDNPPVPIVSLNIEGNGQPSPWPDEMPLPLKIKVEAQNPLKKVLLKIKTKQKESYENVSAILNETTFAFEQIYPLSLEAHMQEDIMEFEIIAAAVDNAQPQPLIGQSHPIVVKVASAYGRYKAALTTLSRIKTKIDTLADNTSKMDPEITSLANEASKQSETTPFFDTLDRMNLEGIFREIHSANEIQGQEFIRKMLDVNHKLSEFLYEHESLDDRERDRDFFIAMRTISRILEKPKSSRAVPLSNLINRLTSFLDQRNARWKLRVERLGNTVKLLQWPKIRDGKPFHRGLVEISKLDEDDQANESQNQIVKITNLYKAWIDELESKEDEIRKKKEQEQQQGLANARNELRDIQQKQDQISSSLDRASQRSKEDLETKWQSARPSENSNIKQAQSLLEQLKQLSPNAGERLKGAIEAMESTIVSGNGGSFSEAESFSDMAGRLLRDAEQSAAKSQQQQKERGRRKRTTGDDYFGNTIVGGDIETKTEYNVDPRYREEILRNAGDESDGDGDKTLLDNYLRQILR